ncbi:Nucleoside-diphosphate-sugar epimerase [Lachnospiraceae bacterium C10]|jgi:nucleoside-diphosphate-sugar epimerase|nr:Nucleoside-diphosphate-sugar epimerase [Lachnospiraceae bacterium C10]
MNQVMQEDIEMILGKDIAWDKFRNTKVLVTGASGMMGSYVVRTLLALDDKGYGVEVYGLMRNPSKMPEEMRNRVHVIQQSVTEPIATDVKFDYIFHTASPASPLIMREDPVGTVAANTLGAWYTLKLAKESESKGYLFISSREIYGQPYDDQKVFTEDTYGFVDPLNVRSCYPEGKKAAETMAVCYHEQYGLNTKIARLAHTLGPGMTIDDGRVQADFLRDVVNHRDIVLKSEGKPIRTYTYVADATAALFYIMLNSPEEERVYNISSEADTVSIRDLAQKMTEAFPERGLSLKFDIPKKTGNDGTAPFTLGILSSEKIGGIGWKPHFTLTEAIQRTVRYLESEGIH